MAANVSVPNNFVAGAPSVADDVDANFAAIVNWINANAVHLDASKAFTAVPSGPTGTDPTSADQLARKAYVDARADVRCGVEVRRATTTQSIANGSTAQISWDQEVDDTDAFWTSGPTVTIPAGKGGIYVVSVVFYNSSLTFTNSNIQTLIQFGGTGIPGPTSNGWSGSNTTAVSYTQRLNAGESVTVSVRNTSGSAVTLNAHMTLYRVSL